MFDAFMGAVFVPVVFLWILHSLMAAVPEYNHMIHCYYHIKNVMLQNSENFLICKDTLCMGHPIFELASILNDYNGFSVS